MTYMSVDTMSRLGVKSNWSMLLSFLLTVLDNKIKGQDFGDGAVETVMGRVASSLGEPRKDGSYSTSG